MSLSTEKTDLDSLVLQVGEVQAIPTANTVLDRLKTIATNTGVSSSNFTATNSTNVNLSKTDLDTILTNTNNLIKSSAGTYGQVTLNANPKLIIASNVNRKSIIIQAATNTSVSYLGYDNTVTSTKYFASLSTDDVYSQDSYTGDIYISNVTATDKVNYGEV
jgi:hypothetical protein